MDDFRLHASVAFVSKRILYWTALDQSASTFEKEAGDQPAMHNPVMSAWMNAPKATFAIQFAERLISTVDHDGETVELRSDLLNIGPRHLVNGKVWSAGDSFLRHDRQLFKRAVASPVGKCYQLTDYAFFIAAVRETDVIVEPEELERWAKLKVDSGA